MSADFEMALDECLARLEGGDNLDTCLAAYPAQAAELRPLLEMAGGLRAAPPPRARAEAVAAGKQRVMAAFAAQPLSPVTPAPGIWRTLATLVRRMWQPATPANSALRFAVGILIVAALGATSAVAASSGTLPGDTLYPVKQSVESLRLALTLDNQSRQALETQFEGQRLLEIQSLLQLRREATVEFEDVLRSVGDNGWWSVGPFAIQVDESTLVVGQPAQGERVKVQVRIQGDGSLVALRIVEETGHEHEPEHGTGLDNLHFGGSTPTVTPTHEAEHAPATEPTTIHHGEEPEHRLDKAVTPMPVAPDQPAPVSTAEHGDAPAVHTPTQMPAPNWTPQHAEPTANPAHHAEPPIRPPQQPTPVPPAEHQTAPAQPSHETASTTEPAHGAPAPPAPEEPRHSEPAPGEDGHDSGDHR